MDEIEDYARQFFGWYRILRPRDKGIPYDNLKIGISEQCKRRKIPDISTRLDDLLESARNQGIVYCDEPDPKYEFLMSPFTAGLAVGVHTEFPNMPYFVEEILDRIETRLKEKARTNPILSDFLRLTYKVNL